VIDSALLVRAAEANGRALREGLKGFPGPGCQCYPECRVDCPDSAKCLEMLPVYWTKEYRAKRYAKEVRERKPEMQVRRINA
jgi:hypothetical protein